MGTLPFRGRGAEEIELEVLVGLILFIELLFAHWHDLS